MKFSSFYEFKKEQLPRQLYEEIRYSFMLKYSKITVCVNTAQELKTLRSNQIHVPKDNKVTLHLLAFFKDNSLSTDGVECTVHTVLMTVRVSFN